MGSNPVLTTKQNKNMENKHLTRQVDSVKYDFDNIIDALISEIEELESNNAKLQWDIDSLKERISDLESDVRSYQ